MFKKLKNKIQVELEKDHHSNSSMCSSMSSSKVDLTQEEHNHKNQIFESPSIIENLTNNIKEEDDNLDEEEDECDVDSKNEILINNSEKNKTNDKHNLKKVKQENKAVNGYLDCSLGETDGEKTINDKNELINKKLEKLLKSLNKSNEKILKLENDNKDLKSTNHEINLRNDKLLNKLDELKTSYKQLAEKNVKMIEVNKNFVLKNEELTQSMNTLQENLNNQLKEKMDIQNEFNKFKMNVQIKENRNNDKIIAELNDKISRLENIISEKNTTIKLQNQRIHDIKKSVQKGDFLFRDENKQKTSSNLNLDNGYSSTNGSNFKLDESNKQIKTNKLNNAEYISYINEISFKYLQNVVFKFITSNDYESQKQLVKAISLLLKFNENEELSVRQSIEARKTSNAWFKLPENLKF